MLQGGNVPLRCHRFIYGNALDHCEFPCYLLWPCRDQGEYWLVDTMTDGYFKLSTETYFRPLGLHHFYDAFSLDGRANLRQDALAQFQLNGRRADERSAHQLQCFGCSGASTKSNPKLPLLVQQDGIESHKASLPQNKGRRNKVIRRRKQVSPALIQRSLVTNRMDLLKIMPALLSEDIHQHGLMVVAYRGVGNEYTVDRGQLRKGLKALQDFESVPRRWPLARLTVPLLKSVDHLDRVLAGCCSEVLITRKYPDDSLGALRQAARSLTLTLASYLAEFVAENLRARTSQGAPLTDEENIHLLGANYWVQPIYQELLHAASGHNASVEGERKRPCSGLVKIMAKQRQTRTRAPVLNTACVSDWIGGFCPADSLMIWFPAHWAPQVIKELERREQDHRKRFPQWFDDRVPNKYYTAPYCLNPGCLVLLACSMLFGSNATTTTRLGRGRSHPNGTYSTITSGTLAPATRTPSNQRNCSF